MAQVGNLIVNGASKFLGNLNTNSAIKTNTQAAGTNNTTMATTAFVQTAITNAIKAIIG